MGKALGSDAWARIGVTGAWKQRAWHMVAYGFRLLPLCSSLKRTRFSSSGVHIGFGANVRGYKQTVSKYEERIKSAEAKTSEVNDDIDRIRTEFHAAKRSFLEIPEALMAMSKMNPQGIYVNRGIRLDLIQVYGFDYDFTLVHYSANLQSLIYDLAKEHMVNEFRYPESQRCASMVVAWNMLPVPFIILYLKRFATFLAGKNQSAFRFLDMIFKRAKEKDGPVEEFQWLGLMLLAFPLGAQADLSTYISAPGIVQQISALHLELMALQSEKIRRLSKSTSSYDADDTTKSTPESTILSVIIVYSS
ncbi:Metal-dependent phosphohydrolase isoform 1 [Hibiscus syriacus]|uniref:Metal-dependent phosphohydrolase isoform 1 n=1 Tax=Hibiscus syriacus TaxID=106335 RepID=A0A6A3AXF9_HIBSY|nr:Metal-dependent phosphohydrolase isoform 1 [Hibiscus syriacus]